MPPLFLWALGVAGATVMARWLVKEYHRVNAELHGADNAPVEAEGRPTLKQDPATGIYRPN